ncbi:MAG: TIGR03905 family TSCPD domain-containing protein [Atopobiaceae bacterium]
MFQYDFTPRGVCSRAIHVALSDDGQTVEGVRFEGGCNGNLKAIGKLTKGMSVDKVVELLQGTTCGPRRTSCADQMTIALRQAQQAMAHDAAASA